MTDRTNVERFVAAFHEADRRGGRPQPGWLSDARRAAIDRFAARGWPTTRDEDWKYTSLGPVLETGLDPAPGPAEEPSPRALTPLLVGSGGYRLVFVNGRLSAALSRLGPLPRGVRIAGMAEMLATDADPLRAHLASDAVDDAFLALNAALWRDGAYVSVPAGVRLPEPVLLLFLSTSGDAAAVVHPRSLFVLGPNSEATLVESHAALAPDVYVTNAVTDIVLGDDARFEHTKLGLESPRAFHVGRTRVRQARDSRFTSCSVTFGGRLVRNEVRVDLAAEGADAALGALFVVGGRQHVDTHTVVDHAAPRAASRQLVKGVLDGQARGIFSGRVVVRRGADGTDAQQTNKNLLLSDGVEVASKPHLEIFADDVKCGHGAADGQLAPEALFYLKSRGLDDGAARTLLTYGFANEVLARIGAAAVREWLEARLMARLARGHVVEPDAAPAVTDGPEPEGALAGATHTERA